MSDTFWKLDTAPLVAGLEVFNTKVHAAIDMYGQTAAKDLEGYAKRERPWTDRTGDARKRLTGSAGWGNNTTYRIVVAHGVDYGLWLELAHEKNYAICEPTINLKSPEVIAGMNRLLERIHS